MDRAEVDQFFDAASQAGFDYISGADHIDPFEKLPAFHPDRDRAGKVIYDLCAFKSNL